MKKITAILIFAFALLSCGGSATDKGKEKVKDFKVQVKDNYAPGEEAALQVLLAYKTKNVDLLKEYASGIMSMALDEDAMERPDFEKELNGWKGDIKEVRYDSDEITFQKYYYAYAHYYTDKDAPDKVYIVGLQSTDKNKWVITVNPLRSIAKSKFEEKSKQLPE